MNAKQFFGIGKPKDNAKKVRQVGHTGSVSHGGGNIQRKTTVKQVGQFKAGGFNKQEVRQGKTAKAGHRPNLPGKVYNSPRVQK